MARQFVTYPAIELPLYYHGIFHNAVQTKVKYTTYDLTEWGFPLILSVRNILLALGAYKNMCNVFKKDEIFNKI